jgi:hypothetical protein
MLGTAITLAGLLRANPVEVALFLNDEFLLSSYAHPLGDFSWLR